jgi:hypothetical protein
MLANVRHAQTGRERQDKNYGTNCSRVVSHRSTGLACSRFTSGIGRVLVFPTEYGRSCPTGFVCDLYSALNRQCKVFVSLCRPAVRDEAAPWRIRHHELTGVTRAHRRTPNAVAARTERVCSSLLRKHVMAQPRFNTFDPPHKGLRLLLGRFVDLAGRTDFESAAELKALQKLGSDLFHLLDEHALTEEKYVFSALKKAIPGYTAPEEQQHAALEAEGHKLRDALAAFDGSPAAARRGHDLLLDAAAFQARYLLHIDAEERHTHPLLLQTFSDAELLAIEGEIIKDMDFPSLLKWIHYIFPARRHAENLAMLRGMHANMPPPVFEQVREAVKNALSPVDFDALVSAL